MTKEERLERLYGLVPANFRNADVANRLQLKRFLQILQEGGLEPLRQDTEGLLELIDFDRIPAEYLPHLASTLGFEFPYDLDETTQRSYIKNAVISYRIKGTAAALEFMIRELTRFETYLLLDEVNRGLEIRLEVDSGRQGFDRLVEKVDFLVREYAPPLGNYNLVNFFHWEEYWDGRTSISDWDNEEDGYTVIPPLTDLGYETGPQWFRANIGFTNDFTTPTFSGESYLADIREDFTERITMA